LDFEVQTIQIYRYVYNDIILRSHPIESGILVEKCHGYQYEHCFSYDWQTMRGYHYLMRLGHTLNVLARHSYALSGYVRAFGVRGPIAFVRNTIAAPWLSARELQQIATAPCQIRLE